MSREIRLIAMEGIPVVEPGDDLAALHLQACLLYTSDAADDDTIV